VPRQQASRATLYSKLRPSARPRPLTRPRCAPRRHLSHPEATPARPAAQSDPRERRRTCAAAAAGGSTRPGIRRDALQLRTRVVSCAYAPLDTDAPDNGALMLELAAAADASMATGGRRETTPRRCAGDSLRQAMRSRKCAWQKMHDRAIPPSNANAVVDALTGCQRVQGTGGPTSLRQRVISCCLK
jgi:hypothetical protein